MRSEIRRRFGIVGRIDFLEQGSLRVWLRLRAEHARRLHEAVKSGDMADMGVTAVESRGFLFGNGLRRTASVQPHERAFASRCTAR